MSKTLYKPVLTLQLPPGFADIGELDVTTDGYIVVDGRETRIHLPALAPGESAEVDLSGLIDGSARGRQTATADFSGINILKALHDEVDIDLA